MKSIAEWVYKVITIVTTLILGWVVLVFTSQGLEVAPNMLLFGIFIILVAIGCLAYRQRYRRLLQWGKKRFPGLTIDKILKIGLIIALVLGVVARLGFLTIGSRYGEESLTDNGIHWYYAPAIVNGEEIQPTEGIYAAFFPHLMTYSATLAFFMRIFGTGYSAIVFSNLLFDLVTVFVIYLLLGRWRGQRAARIGAIIWLLNPLEILFCSCSLSIVVTNMWLAIALLLGYLAIQALQQREWWQIILTALGLGLAIGIGNAYRPIFTVLVIAFTLVLGFQVLQHGKQLKRFVLPAIISLVMVLGASFGCGKIVNLVHQSINPYAVEGVGVGWNFFVGANYESSGHWTREDSALLGPLLYDQPASDTDVVAIQQQFLDMTIERYKAIGITKILPHLVNKSITLFADDSETVAWAVPSGFHLSDSNPVYLAIHSLGVILFVACIVLSLVYCLSRFWSGKWQIDSYSLFLMLCLCGIIAVSLMVEVMRRYTMPLLVIFVILAATQLSKHPAKA